MLRSQLFSAVTVCIARFLLNVTNWIYAVKIWRDIPLDVATQYDCRWFLALLARSVIFLIAATYNRSVYQRRKGIACRDIVYCLRLKNSWTRTRGRTSRESNQQVERNWEDSAEQWTNVGDGVVVWGRPSFIGHQQSCLARSLLDV